MSSTLQFYTFFFAHELLILHFFLPTMGNLLSTPFSHSLIHHPSHEALKISQIFSVMKPKDCLFLYYFNRREILLAGVFLLETGPVFITHDTFINSFQSNKSVFSLLLFQSLLLLFSNQ